MPIGIQGQFYTIYNVSMNKYVIYVMPYKKLTIIIACSKCVLTFVFYMFLKTTSFPELKTLKPKKQLGCSTIVKWENVTFK